ncbi:class I SAM-dependent methyltransferase [Phenylobacterium sp. LjRoot219]|uniref:class I SAM-dependent methyltransferase n=1 Tax=Phenylobacterium sp. LjRoot219 TaxID=3342283 RepID=UPI003ECFCF52
MAAILDLAAEPAPKTAGERIAEAEVARALEGVKEVLASTDAEFSSRRFLLSKLKKIGLAYCDWHELAGYADWMNMGQFGVQQIPTEYIDFLMYVAKLSIKTGIEVGVWYGASSYFTAAVLQRANPDFMMTMVDNEDRLVGYPEFSSVLNIEKRVPATAEDCAGEVYDFVFIDGDHAYEGIQRDYLLLGRYARRAVAFHDVRGAEFDQFAGGTRRFWQEFVHNHCRDMAILEFGHYETPWMGIGLAVKELDNP